jgi:hypothetical protein
VKIITVLLIVLASGCQNIPSPPGETKQLHLPMDWTERPWWADLRPGVFLLYGHRQILAVGTSTTHRDPRDAIEEADINASEALARYHAEATGQPADAPSQRWDLFLDRASRAYALRGLSVPEAFGKQTTAAAIRAPDGLWSDMRRRVGRHIYLRGRHLYAECDVEGPFLSPEWGRYHARSGQRP